MVRVIIKETGEELDVIGDFNYTKQASDIGDIEKVNTSRSWTIKFPKTPNNTKIFQGLGLEGALSNTPYRTIKVSVTNNGLTIVNNGNLQVTETTKDEYKGNIKDGIIDFFNAIGDRPISELDLSEINHDNTRASIINSWSAGLPYKYLVANYNGRFFQDLGGVSNFSNVALVPSVNVEWLMDKVFDDIGWTYEGFDTIYLDWLSYPLSDGFEEALGVIVSEVKPNDFLLDARPLTTIKDIEWVAVANDPTYITQNPPLQFIVAESGSYAITFPNSDYLNDAYGELFILYQTFVNGTLRATTPRYENEYKVIGDLNEGDVITLKIFVNNYQGYQLIGNFTWKGNILLYKKDTSVINFTDAFEIYLIKDFVKEIMMQNAVISIADSEKKHIKFLSSSERVSAPIVDWSKWFNSKESEKYVLGNYAQNNYFKLLYDLDGSMYNDGNLKIDNENLQIESTIFESKAYSAEQLPLEITIKRGLLNHKLFIPTLKNFEIEVKEDGANIEINYKTLSNRFFYLREKEQQGSIAINDELALVTKFPLAVPKTWEAILADKYADVSAVINTAKLVTIKLGASEVMLNNLDLGKRYYFSQVAGTYILNKVTYKDSGLSVGEFIKIN